MLHQQRLAVGHHPAGMPLPFPRAICRGRQVAQQRCISLLGEHVQHACIRVLSQNLGGIIGNRLAQALQDKFERVAQGGIGADLLPNAAEGHQRASSVRAIFRAGLRHIAQHHDHMARRFARQQM